MTPCSFLGQGAPLQNSFDQFRLQQSFHFWNTRFNNSSLIWVEACIIYHLSICTLCIVHWFWADSCILSEHDTTIIVDLTNTFHSMCIADLINTFHSAGSRLDLFAGPMQESLLRSGLKIFKSNKYLFIKDLINQVSSLICKRPETEIQFLC